MATKIEWVKNPDGSQGHSWNPVTGCTKISPGCAHCYAERRARMLAGKAGYPEAPHHFDVVLRPDRLSIPLRRRVPTTYFLPSMGDLFHKDVPDEFICDVFYTMYQCPQHTFQLLTKRIDRALNWFNRPAAQGSKWHKPLPNLWLGISAEYHDFWLSRTHYLKQTPAAVRFVSIEPCLGPFYHIDFDGVDWVIVGGESGPGARPMDPSWVRGIRDQCVAAGVPFFMKQMSRRGPIPEDLMIREFPNA